MSAEIHADTVYTAKLDGSRTKLELYALTHVTDSNTYSGRGIVVVSRVPGVPASNRSHAFGFETPSNTQVDVGSGGFVTNHDVSVVKEGGSIMITRRTFIKEKGKAREFSYRLDASTIDSSAVRVQSGVMNIDSNTATLLAIGAVTAGMRFVRNEASFQRRVRRQLRRKGLAK